MLMLLVVTIRNFGSVTRKISSRIVAYFTVTDGATCMRACAGQSTKLRYGKNPNQNPKQAQAYAHTHTAAAQRSASNGNGNFLSKSSSWLCAAISNNCQRPFKKKNTKKKIENENKFLFAVFFFLFSNLADLFLPKICSAFLTLAVPAAVAAAAAIFFLLCV